MISDKKRIEKIWRKIEASSAEGCWNWNGTKRKDGYGKLMIDGKFVRAHRFFYELIIGRIEEVKVVDHTCRNRSCVNPAHMEIVTRAENTRRGNGEVMNANRSNCCVKGHKRTRETICAKLKRDGTAHIVCRICRNEAQRARNSRGRA